MTGHANSTAAYPADINSRASDASAGLTGDVANASMSCPNVVLEIGIFFDGTGNNRENARQPEHALSVGVDSYDNDFSNIAKLEPLYYNFSRDVKNSCELYATRYGSLYFQGIGTTSGESDSKIGGATGTGSTGVENRVFDAAIQAGLLIKRLAEGVEPSEIVMDVFGFSRGAAAARHFVNSFKRGYLTYDRAFRTDLNAVLPKGRKVRFRFVGLFDTVASIMLGSDGVENHGDLNLHLSDASAETVFHLTAENEFRSNFPLTAALDAPRSRQLLGAHADIGGGYLSRDNETLIDDGGDGIVADTLAQAIELSNAERRRSKASRPSVAKCLADGYMHEKDVDTAIECVVTTILPFVIPRWPIPAVDYSFKVKVWMKRDVEPDLAKIALHIMYKKAVESGVPMFPIGSQPEFAFPDDVVFRAAAAKMVAGGNPTEAQRAYLMRYYVHHSADYKPHPVFRFPPMKPTQDRIRVIHTNNPGLAD